MNGQFKKTMKVQARKGLLLMLCFLLLPVVSLVAPGGVAQAEPDLIPPSAVTTVFTGSHYGFDIHDGYLYMASRNTGKITRIKINEDGNVEDGAQLEDFITDLSYAMSVAFDSEGNLYYTKDASGINKVSADKLPTNGQSISASTPNFSQRVAVHGGYNHNMAFDSQDNLYFSSIAYEPRRAGVYRVQEQNLGTNLPAEQVFEYVDSISIQQLTFDAEDNLYFAIGRKIYTVKNEVVSGTSISTNEVQEFQELQTGQIAYGLRIFQNKFYYSDMGTVKRIEAVDLSPVLPEPEKWVPVITGSNETLSKIIYANGRYMAVGNDGVIAHSVDGDNWTSLKPHATDSLMALMYQNGDYFAAGNNGIVLRGSSSETDIVTWERMQVAITEPVTRTNPLYDYYDFVPSGESGFLLVGSKDAMVVYDEYEDEIGLEIEWMDFTPDNGTAVVRKVDNTSSVQVAVGQNMLLRFMESPDDNREGEAEPTEPVWTTWTFNGEDSNLHLYGAASFSKEISETLKEERYVVVGDDGLIFTSTTGKTWTKVDSPTEESLYSVHWIDGRFYAVGEKGTLISSEDGEEWKKHLLAGEPEFDFYDIAKGPAGLIIVGQNGKAMRQEIVRVDGVVLKGEGLVLEDDEDIHTLTLVEGRPAVTLEAIVHPEDAVNKDVVWSLAGQSEEGVATLEDGVVTPLKVGTALITVTTVDGGFTSRVNLVVKSSLIPVTGVTLDELEQYTLVEGGSVPLVANVQPSDATDPEVEWSTSDEDVVVVSEEGIVTAIGLGQATITVKTLDGGFEATADFTVVRPATGVTVSPETETLAVGGPNVTLNATVTPTGSTNGAVTWTSSDNTVATVNSAGVVTPVSQGTATITATTQGGLTDTAQITVVQLVSGIVVNPSTLSLDERASETLTATVAPVNATNPAVAWTTSNPEVATVDSNGLVTAVSKGTATITATSADGVHTNSSTVTVIRRAASVSIAPELLNLHENGATAVLTATVAPGGTNNTNVTWRSADTSIAEVNANGVVTPKNIGSTTITVRTVDGGHEYSIPVTVGPNVASDVHLNLYLLNMKQGGQTEQLIATVTPSNASNKKVTWKSGDPSVATVVNGLVTPVGPGSTYITVETEDGGFTKQARVIVEQTIWPVTSVKINQQSLELTVGKPGEKLTATVAPANATNKAVSWSSSNSAVATVSVDGVVTPVAEGKATVKVTTVDGTHSDSIAVEVKAATPPPQPQPPFSGGVIVAPPADPTEEITGVVDGGAASGAGLSSFTIKRTSGSNGAKQDAIALEANKTKEAADKAKAAGLPIIRVSIPDAKDEVSDTTVTLPVSALQHLKNDEIGLELSTANARIIIGSESLAEQNQELYFRLTPLKTVSEQTQVESRAGAQAVVQQTVGEGSFDLVGRPVTIETNMKGQRVEIILPITANLLPSNAAEREAWLSRLVIFIEHSDGERVVVQPQVVTDASGQVGLSFEINKFSTFSILEIQPAAETEPEVNGRHEAYMSGYEDGTFRPSRQVTRAELAAILARLYTAAATENVSAELTDIDTHWAEASIRAVVAGGYMQGYPDGTFQPNRVLSRAEIAAILARVQGLTYTGVATFADVASGHWAEGYIGAVQQAGLMTGYEGNEFRPGQGVTRAEVVVIFNRVLRRGPLTGVSEPSWSDVSVSHWAFGHIEEASRTHDYIVVDGVEELVQ